MSQAVKETPSVAPASRDEADAWLRDRATRTVRAHLRTRGDADFARSVKSMIDQTVHEYGGRFLFELIQNGYDEQDSEGDSGSLALVLTHDEGDYGVLYIANTGRGFTHSNVRAIANLGLSDKKIGEGIGNKGVGFKSVLQICDVPEIYSTLPDGAPGFCFRFASPEDIPGLVNDDPASVEHVLEEMSLYSITVPAEATPTGVEELWEEGYSTVIRLPLRSDAGQPVVERLADLTNVEAPVLLFLRRISQIVIRTVRGNEHTETVLTRDCEQPPDLHADLGCDVVTLDGSARYLVFTQEVPRDAVAHAVSEAVEGHQLDPRWQKSTSRVEVSIAVPYRSLDAADGRYYTYLPLGAKAPSPFAGHLNAPFSTNLARTDIDTTNPLNRLLLDAAASLCLGAAEALTKCDDYAPNSVLDIISWDTEQVSVLAKVSSEQGIPLAKRLVMPTRTPGHWTSMEATRRWPALGTEILTADLASASCKVDFLPEIGQGRARRVDTMFSAMKLTADPSPEQLASWTETMLATMLQERLQLSDWDKAYSDIALIFARSHAALRSRRILLTDDWELRACASGIRSTDTLTPREATPFFPPARQRVDEEDDVDPDADLDLPKSLSRRMFYLNSGLTWYTNRQQTPARNFLQDNRLVRRFDTRSIFEHIRGVLDDSRSHSVARDALRLVFNLSRSGASNADNLSELGMRVPAANGKWIRANDALFSAGWPGTTGDDLTLIAGTPEHRSKELHALASRLLAAPTDLLSPTDKEQIWVDFLRRIGVSDVLALNQVSDGRTISGRGLTRRWLSQVPDLPDPIREQWIGRLPDRSSASYPDTPYKATSPLYWLPGQADWSVLHDEVRQAICRQILLGLKTWDSSVYLTGWDRDRRGDKDRQRVDTPLRAFLASAAWLPQQQPGSSVAEFVPPSRCWTFPIRGDETAPRFAPLLSKRLRDILDDDPTSLSHLRQLGLAVWGSAEDSPRLVRHLGEQFAQGAIPDAHLAQFRNIYQRSWADCVRRKAAEPFPPDAISHLVVTIGGSTTSLPIGPSDTDDVPTDVVVAAADDARSLLRLLADFRRPVLTVTSNVDEVTRLLQTRLGNHAVRATEVAPMVLVDGTRFDPTEAATAPPIVDVLPALPVLVATLLQFRRGSFSHIGQRAFEEALDTLRRVRLVSAREIKVRIGTETRPLPSRSQGVLSVPDHDYPALIVARGENPLNWGTLDALGEPLMYLIGRPEFTTEFRLAATRMQATEVPLAELEYGDVANACEITVDDVQTAAHRIKSSMTPLLDRLYPVVAHYAGTRAAEPFDPNSSGLTGEIDTREELARIADNLPLASDELLTLALDAPSLDSLRISLQIPLGALNTTLSALGGRHKPIDYSEQLGEDFADHVRRTHNRILDKVRWARWDRFTRYDPQPDWTTLRRPDTISPDPQWGLSVDSLSPDSMDARVNAELERLLGTTPPSTGPSLATVNECAKVNADLITTSIGTLAETVRAWLAVLGIPADSPWSEPESAARTLLDALDEAGALDFTELGMDGTLRWLQVLELWPSDMPATVDQDALGLRAADIEAQRSDAEHRRNEAVRARRTLYIDDQPFDLGSGMTELRAAIDASLKVTPGFMLSRNRFTPLKEVQDRTDKRGNSDGGPASGIRQPRLTDRQREGIGFAGEWLAYKWLEQLHADDFTPACWVSAYRELSFPGLGNDGLGWDFEVPTRQGKLRYEVKTSQGEGGQIELGETQVLAAQRHARKDRWRLLIITNALNENRRIRMLRNPFDPKSRGHYTFVGQGLRLRYTLD